MITGLWWMVLDGVMTRCLELYGIDKKLSSYYGSLSQRFNVLSFSYSFHCCIAQQKTCPGLKVDESRLVKLLISERVVSWNKKKINRGKIKLLRSSSTYVWKSYQEKRVKINSYDHVRKICGGPSIKISEHDVHTTIIVVGCCL